MALINTISLTESKSGTSIVLQDTTGVYNITTNPTGYGIIPDTISTRAIAVIRGAFINITPPKSVIPVNVQISAVNAQLNATVTTPYTITNALFGGTSADTLVGVYKVEYVVYFVGDAGHTTTYTNGSNVVACSSGGISDFTNAKYITVNGVGTVYEIASIVGNNIYLTTNFAGITVTLANSLNFIGYSTIKYIAAQNTIKSCIHNSIAKLSVEHDCGCGCEECEKTESNCGNLTLFFGINANMDNLKYSQAQTIIDYLVLKCSSDDCNCN